MFRIRRREKEQKEGRTILEKRTGGMKAFFGVILAILILYSFSLVAPMLWVFITTFKDASSVADINTNAFALPDPWYFSNWGLVPQYLVVKGQTYFYMLFNSIWMTVGRSFLYITFKTLTAYCVAKYKNPFTKAVYAVALVVMMIPIVGNLPATYKLYTNLGFVDSPLFLLAATGGLGFEFVMITGFFRSVSDEYAESAQIDGAGHWTIFLKIMLPMAMGPISALFIMAFVGFWNDYMASLLYMPSYYMLSSGLYVYKQLMAERSMNIPVYYAGVITAILPCVVIFVLFQEKIMTNVAVGGLKG